MKKTNAAKKTPDPPSDLDAPLDNEVKTSPADAPAPEEVGSTVSADDTPAPETTQDEEPSESFSSLPDHEETPQDTSADEILEVSEDDRIVSSGNESVVELELSRIRLSPQNPRKTLVPRKLEELAASIAAKGVLQPIVVREVAPDASGADHEIVFGERRFRASQLAGKKTIPAIVREFTEAELREVRIIENLQREDIHPIEEADAFNERIRAGTDVRELAAKLGKTVGYVYGRLALSNLCPAAREAYAKGQISHAVAPLIARISNPSVQDRAVKDILSYFKEQGAPMEVSGARRILEKSYMLVLRNVSFSVKDATLVPAAGACTDCPKRSGNTRPQGLFGDVAEDNVCLDPDCFESKVDAAWKRRCEEAKAAGVTVIEPEQSKDVFYPYSGQIVSSSGYVDLDQQIPGDDKRRTYRQALGKKFLPEKRALARDHYAKPHEIAKEKDVRAAMIAAGVISVKSVEKQEKKEQAEKTAKKEQKDALSLRKAVVTRGTEDVACAVESLFEGVKLSGPVDSLIRLALTSLFHNSFVTSQVLDSIKADRQKVEKELPKMALPKAAALLARLAIASDGLPHVHYRACLETAVAAFLPKTGLKVLETLVGAEIESKKDAGKKATDEKAKKAEEKKAVGKKPTKAEEKASRKQKVKAAEAKKPAKEKSPESKLKFAKPGKKK